MTDPTPRPPAPGPARRPSAGSGSGTPPGAAPGASGTASEAPKQESTVGAVTDAAASAARMAKVGSSVAGPVGTVVGGVAGAAGSLAKSKKGPQAVMFGLLGSPVVMIPLVLVVIVVLMMGSMSAPVSARNDVAMSAVLADGVSDREVGIFTEAGSAYGTPWEILAAIPYVYSEKVTDDPKEYDAQAQSKAIADNEPLGPYHILFNDMVKFSSEHQMKPLSFSAATSGPASAMWVSQAVAAALDSTKMGDLSFGDGAHPVIDPNAPDTTTYEIDEKNGNDVKDAQTVQDAYIEALGKLPIEDAQDKAEAIFRTALVWHNGGKQTCDAGTAAASAPSSVAGISQVALQAYVQAGQKSGVPWYWIAGIGKIESGHGTYGGAHPDDTGEVVPEIIGIPLNGSNGTAVIRDTDGGRWDHDTVYDRAVGPMQFIPGTWESMKADGNGDGVSDPHNMFDAALATGQYLAKSGAPGDMHKAVFAYNHSEAYYIKVSTYANEYKSAGPDTSALINTPVSATSGSSGSSGSSSSGSGTGTAPSQGSTSAQPNQIRVFTQNVNWGNGKAKISSDLAALVPRADAITMQEVKDVAVTNMFDSSWTTYQNLTPSPLAGSAVATRSALGTVVSTGSAFMASEARRGGQVLMQDRFVGWQDVRLPDNKMVRIGAVHFPPQPQTSYKHPEFTRNFIAWGRSSPYPLIVGGDWNQKINRDPDGVAGALGLRILGYNIDGILVDRSITVVRSWQEPLRNSDHHAVGAILDTSTMRATKQTTSGQIGVSAGAQGNGSDLSGQSGGVQMETGNTGGWVMPVHQPYTIGQAFGAAGGMWSSGHHTGQDFVVPTGTPVYAVQNGVAHLTPTSWGGPNMITVDHGMVNGKKTESLYAHLSKAMVTDGQQVHAGDQIGLSGALGNVTGPHLHFEVRVDGQPVDPMPFLANAGQPVPGASDGCGADPSVGAAANISTDYATDPNTGAWGGYSNGKIPLSALMEIPWQPGQYVRPDAGQALIQLNTAFKAKFGRDIGPIGGYRPYEDQVSLHAQKPTMTAVPGTSNHGWALAVDISITSYSSPEYKWMDANAPTYGWINPPWARSGGSRNEPWHWQFGLKH